MTIVYWLAAAFAIAAFISGKFGRAALPAVLFVVLSLLLFIVTPSGQEAVAAILRAVEIVEASK